MYYTIYKITNKVNGKFYIGTHKTKNLDDNYMGSGKYLKHAINKYGIENFEKEILFVFDNPEEMYAKEAEIVNEDFLAEENTYNLKVGGFGGWDYVNSQNDQSWRKEASKKGNKVKSDMIKRSPEMQEQLRRSYLENMFSESAMQKKKKWIEENPDHYKGRTHNKKTREILSKLAKERLSDPSNNPTYGKRWVHSLVEERSMLIPKTDALPAGWKEGRKINFSPPRQQHKKAPRPRPEPKYSDDSIRLAVEKLKTKNISHIIRKLGAPCPHSNMPLRNRVKKILEEFYIDGCGSEF